MHDPHVVDDSTNSSSFFLILRYIFFSQQLHSFLSKQAKIKSKYTVVFTITRILYKNNLIQSFVLVEAIK